jgi:uncharacterized protein YcsI (UPF0317 family)
MRKPQRTSLKTTPAMKPMNVHQVQSGVTQSHFHRARGGPVFLVNVPVGAAAVAAGLAVLAVAAIPAVRPADGARVAVH